jgi:hypothetical protein
MLCLVMVSGDFAWSTPEKKQVVHDVSDDESGPSRAAPAVRGENYCSLHSDPNRAAELGRKGGARSRKVYDSQLENVAVPESAADVRRMLAEAMAETRAGKMDPKLGAPSLTSRLLCCGHMRQIPLPQLTRPPCPPFTEPCILAPLAAPE